MRGGDGACTYQDWAANRRQQTCKKSREPAAAQCGIASAQRGVTPHGMSSTPAVYREYIRMHAAKKASLEPRPQLATITLMILNVIAIHVVGEDHAVVSLCVLQAIRVVVILRRGQYDTPWTNKRAHRAWPRVRDDDRIFSAVIFRQESPPPPRPISPCESKHYALPFLVHNISSRTSRHLL